MPRESPPDPPQRHSLALKLGCIVLAILLAVVLTSYWIYGTNTRHTSRNSIWWTERGRNLIPPAATDIILRQDLLDHDAIYTISESDLNDFLDERFARPGEVLDSFSERSTATPESIGKEIGPLGWVVTEDTVKYTYAASNGGTHVFYHDSKTGLTYQDSAYW